MGTLHFTQVKDKKTGKKEDKNKRVRPIFFKYCGEGKEYKFREFDTPMDYLEAIVKGIPPAKRSTTIDIDKVLVEKQVLNDANRKQINKIKEIVSQLDNDIKHLYADKYRDKEEDIIKIENLKEKVIAKINKMKVRTETVMNIFNRMYSKNSKDKDIKDYKMLLLGLLYKAQESVILELFKQISIKGIEILEENTNGNIMIFGVRYIKTKIN